MQPLGVPVILDLTRWVLRHRLLVVLGWLALTLAGGAAVTPAINAMTSDFGALPGRPGYETNEQILRTYGNGGGADPLLRSLLVPALVVLFRQWNWWLPRPLARVLLVGESPTAAHAGPAHPIRERTAR